MQPTKFVRLWLTEKTTPQIAKELSVSEATVYSFAKKLRGLGVNLPQRKVQRGTTINVSALNELIESEK